MQNLIALEDLFHKRLFRVPDYQRGYAWGESQIQDFLDDLEVLTPSRVHYTGTVVLHVQDSLTEEQDQSGNTYAFVDIVDGQQRLTTTVLLLDGIRNALDSLNDGEQPIPLSIGVQNNYIATTGANGLPLFKLTLNKDTNDYFRSNILAAQPGPEPAANAAERRLTAAKSQIRDYIRSKMEGMTLDEQQAWLRDLHRKVTSRLGFTLYEVDDASEVGVIFEVMNDRGKPLTELEKVKNYLLYVSSTLELSNDLSTRVNNAWATIFTQLTDAGRVSSADEDQLLRVHWLSHYSPVKKEWDGVKSIRARFDLRKFADKQQELLLGLVEYTETLRGSCISFCDAHSPRRASAFGIFHEAGRSKVEQVRVWSEKLRRIRALATFLPLLVAVRARWPNDADKYLEIVRLCEAYAFRVYRLGGWRADAGEPALYRLAYSVMRDEETFANTIIRFKRELAYRCGDDTLSHLLDPDSEQIKIAYGWRGLRYFLYEYEISLAQKRNGSPRVPWSDVSQPDLKDTIEHILPQTLSDEYWTDRFGNHESSVHQSYVHNLGNLTLSKWNAHYLNKPFPEKKGKPAGDAEFCYAKAFFFAEQELLEWEDWTPATIDQRRNRLLAWARQRWSVDFSDIARPTPEEEPPDDEHEEDSEEPLDDAEV